MRKAVKLILATCGDWLAVGVWVAVFAFDAVSSQLRRFSSGLKRCFYGVMTLAVVGFSTHAAEVSFSWRANTEPDLAGYKLYQGPRAGFYTNAIVIGWLATNYTVRVESTNFFALSAFDTDGLESLPTRDVMYVAPSPPNTPAEFKGSALWVITDASCDFVYWEPAITNEAPMIWPMEFYRVRAERMPLR